MTELLPSLQALRLRDGLVDYLTTTFALADAEPRQALTDFLQDPESGIFKGPYVRLRLPFRIAETAGASPLDWQPPFPPYRHQDEAYRRLTSKDLGPDKPRPLPTVVTTGTGSGKTEAFLNPIIDHVLRARRDGVTGMKALILYPMNALADDQAGRLIKLITEDPALATVTAGLYTGDANPGQGQGRSKVTKDGLITNRTAMRDTPPDILLTNYKMLDQLLLRPEDAPLWSQSALSLTYLVLDEFHTYDGAQGTDVAMLLRRLGLRLRSHVPEDHPERAFFDACPLGKVTPVATSATLGDGGDPSAMLDFAEEVFGEPFDRDAAITERRVDAEAYSDAARTAVAAGGRRPRRLAAMLSSEVHELAGLGRRHRDNGDRLVEAVADQLYGVGTLGERASAATLLRAHDDIRALIDTTAEAVPMASLAADRFGADVDPADALAAIATILAALSHIRLSDRNAVSVEITQWVRELTRLDRVVSTRPAFRWSDDGPSLDETQAVALPAIYCRSCGRSGWGISLAPTGRDLAASDGNIRAEHLRKTGRFRALLHAPGEAALVAERRAQGDPQPEQHAPNLRWLDISRRTVLSHAPADDDEDLLEGRILPVVMLDGDTEEIEQRSKGDYCPSCGKRDQIRFLGSAVATLLSVSLSTLFGDATLDPGEKRALVFTDSVQDAAHRAGFVDTRSHTLSLRAALRAGLDKPMSLVEWADEVLRRADADGFSRYRLVPRPLLDNDYFRSYWSARSASRIPAKGRTAMRRRLLFDVELEVGLQASYGRTLEATGSIGVQVDAGSPERVVGLARRACATDGTDTLPIEQQLDDAALRRWVHGALEHLRRDGAIEHDWLHKYVQADGARIWVWSKRRRDQGAPAFPSGRGAPAFAVTDGSVDSRSDFVRVTSPQSWYARWAQKCLGVNAAHGASLAARLFKELSKADVVREVNTDKGAHAFGLPPDVIRAMPLSDDDLRDRVTLVVCDTCHSPVPTTPDLGDLLVGGPCTTDRCKGTLRAAPRDPESFYRRLFANSDMRRVDAHEHTSLIDPLERRHIEAGFKRTDQQPGDPNVLVATPTLEMGIDIGDLTTVMLSSLPDSVAKYVQRVGRAGRLTGSSLALAYVTGRGDQLPQLGQPTSMINGTVRPPATYLDAEEILRRQFLAHVIDDMARSGRADIPRTAGEALASSEPGSFLGDVIDRVNRDGQRLLADFVGTFADLETTGIGMLRSWALPADGEPDTFAATVHHAAHQHCSEVEELRRRRKEVLDAIPELRERAELPAASDDDRTAYRSAFSTAKLLKRVLGDLTHAPWISGLEMRGLLPNYSLFDDPVELDAQISWIDPESGKFDSDSLVIPRGSARALTELAPGTRFYAHGLELRVDGIEIGQDQAEVGHFALCDGCGYLSELKSGEPSPQSCPRCGSTGIADTGQRFDAVRLKRVFSEVRRDDAKITDSEDSRRSQRFEVVVAVDFDPARLAEQWSVETAGLGVSHYRRLPVRWFNVGRSSNAPSTRVLAGKDLAAQLFRVCEVCGKLDLEAGTNSPREHRAWCPHRTAIDEHTRELALSRELVTQAVAISLPPSVTADQFSAPSLQAALLLGLRETIGGAPNHLRVEVVPQPLGTGDGATRTALLLHDIVPGGTGYLTDVARPERLWAILVRAARKLESCECQYEERAACHRCLLPFTRDPASVTRLDAIRALRVLLELDEGTTADALELDTPTWDVVERPISADWGESTLEQRFRNALKDRLSKGNAVKESTGPNGTELRISGGGRQWRLRPQVLISGTKPDFELTANGGVGRYTIYTDGHAYHATLAVNRLADDTEKRNALRAQGIHVFGITWDDLTDPTRPAWLNDQVIANLRKTAQGAGISQAVVDELAGGPLALLEGIVHDPNDTARTILARNVPLLLASRPGASPVHLSSEDDLLTVANSLLTDQERSFPASGDPAIVYRTEYLALVARLKGTMPTEVALVLDDTEGAVADPGHADAWRGWLQLSNVLDLTDLEVRISVRTLAEQGTSTSSVPSPVDFEGAWEGSDLTGLSSATVEVARRLTKAGVAQPTVMSEVDGIMVDLVWPKRHVAVLDADAPEEDADDLRKAGWKVVRPGEGEPEQLADEVRSAIDNGEKG